MKAKSNVMILHNIEEDRKKNTTTIWKELILSVFLIVGTVLPFSSFLGGYRVAFLISFGGVVISTLLILSQRSEQMSFLMPVALCALVVLTTILRLTSVMRGILSCVNGAIGRYNELYHGYHRLYAVSEVGSGEILIAGFVCIVIISMLYVYCINKKMTILISIWIFLLVVLSFTLQSSANMYPLIILIMGWIGVWTNDTVRNQYFLEVTGFIAVVIVIAFVILQLLFSGYKTKTSVDNFRENVMEIVHEARYGKDNLPQGDLTKAQELLSKKDEKTLEVTFDTISEMHLKGFVGAEYTGNSWKTLSNSAYVGEQDGMLEWLKANGFDSVYEYAQYISLEKKYGAGDNDNVNESVENDHIKINNNGADRQYVYVPETVSKVEESKYKSNQDWQLLSTAFTGTHKYEFNAYLGTLPAEVLTEPSWLTKGISQKETMYPETEQVYRTFVYAHYLDIEKDQQEEMDRLFFSGKSWTKASEKERQEIYSATSRIRTVLGILANYEEQPQEVPANTDFVSWFLEDYKKGNSVHFASAAVLAYRALGIPARYVEGYYLDEDLVTRLAAQKKTSTQLTEEQGHAWVEIYRDGIGWCPIEVTPGFYSDYYSAEKLIDVPEEEVDGNNNKKNVSVAEHFDSGENKEKQEEDLTVPWKIAGIILGLLLLFLLFLLILEIQRAIRIYLRGKTQHENTSKAEVQREYGQICYLLEAAGMKGSFDYPYERTNDLLAIFPEVEKEDYERVIQIIQKVIFGNSELKQNEKRILAAFRKKIRGLLMEEMKMKSQIWYRYVKAI